jgi:hypothetical protein
MVPLRHRLLVLTMPAVLGLGLSPSSGRSATPPPVRELRRQQVGDVTYFHVRFDTPKRMLPDGQASLVPQDDQARNVYQRRPENGRGGAMPGGPSGLPPGLVESQPPRIPVGVDGLEFVGQLRGKGEVQFLLIYPTESRVPRVGRFQHAPRTHWSEAAVTLDFSKAQKVALPAEARERRNPPREKPATKQKKDEPPAKEEEIRKQPKGEGRRPPQPPQPPVRDDLEGLWAIAQVADFQRLHNEAPDFPFYSFAAQTTARKYNIPGGAAPWGPPPEPPIPGQPRQAGSLIDTQLYETTTGATAIAESLQTQRMLGLNLRDTSKRSVPIGRVEGIDIPEHPWKEMIGDKKPAPEPIARFVPDDNYYVHFHNVRKFIEFSELLDQWGTSLIRAYEVHSRDYRIKERYQEQLCIKSTSLGKTLGPLVLRGVAITGSDAYLREGSDVNVIFHVSNREVFLGAVDTFIAEARKKYGERLTEGKNEYHGVAIQSFTTPLREVSLHRAVLEEFVIYSNSPAGLRRVLDTYQGRHKALADSLDFQYMRTIFRADDKEADGFAFLSDPFIRQLVGPRSKIQEKRRLEALTSMYMLTEGAMFAAWESGRAPADQNDLMNAAGLKADEIFLPEGRPLLWNGERQVAVSDVYNTIHFATPLVELPIEMVTEAEANSYRQFRLQYLGLWRNYFDPIGMRIALNDRQVKIDTYVLPLVRNSTYNELRRVTGDGTVTLDLDSISPRTLTQFLMHLSPNVNDRGSLLGGFFGGPRRRGPGAGEATQDLGRLIAWSLDPVGKWFLVRLDDSEVYGKLADMLEKMDQEGHQVDGEEVTRLVFQIPVMIGVDIKNPLTVGAALASARMAVMQSLPGGITWEPLEKPHKGVSIVRIQATPRGVQQTGIRSRPGKEPFLPAIYYAMIDGAFYLTPSEQMLRDFIDRTQERKEGKGQKVEVNTSVYLSPGAARLSKVLIQKYLERQVHEQAMSNLPVWYSLYHTGLLLEGSDQGTARTAAEKYFGFVPVSPDGSPYVYDRKTDAVRNERHGSQRHPLTPKTLAEDAPLNRLLEQLRTIRADLRFREDGVHTVLTVDRQVKEK